MLPLSIVGVHKKCPKKRVICVLNAISKQVEKFCFKVNGDEIKVSL